jgi:hypothetical protein
MIESIAPIGAISVATPSAGRSTERRQKRLKWLASLRAAGLAEEPNEFVALVQSRARIADALEAEALFDDVDVDDDGDLHAPAIAAADLARIIAAAAAQSLAVQAHLGAATVRRFVEAGR